MGTAKPCLYISGSQDFNPDEKQSDWACSPDYFPKSRYTYSSILETLDSFGERRKSSANELLSLGFTGFLVRDGMHALPKVLTLGKRTRRELAIGYDSGALYLLPPILM